MGGLLNHLSSDPPKSILETLSLLATRCLAGSGEAVAVAPALRAEVFGDQALQKLAETLVVLEGFDSEGGKEFIEQGEAIAET